MTLAVAHNASTDAATANNDDTYKFKKYSPEVSRMKGARAIREERDRMLNEALESAQPLWFLETALALHHSIKVLEDAQN